MPGPHYWVRCRRRYPRSRISRKDDHKSLHIAGKALPYANGNFLHLRELGSVAVGAAHVDPAKALLDGCKQQVLQVNGEFPICGSEVACTDWCKQENLTPASALNQVKSVAVTISPTDGSQTGLDGCIVAYSVAGSIGTQEIVRLERRIASLNRKLEKVKSAPAPREDLLKYVEEFEEVGKVLAFIHEDYCSVPLYTRVSPILLRLLATPVTERQAQIRRYEEFRLALSLNIEGWKHPVFLKPGPKDH